MNRGQSRNIRGHSNPRGRSSPSGGDSTHRHGSVRADGSSSNATPVWKAVSSSHARQTPGKMPMSGDLNLLVQESSPDYPHQQDRSLPGIEGLTQDIGKLGLVQDTPEKANCSSRQMESFSASGSAFKNQFPSLSAQSDQKNRQDDASLLAESGAKDGPYNERPERGQTSPEKTVGCGSAESSSENSNSHLIVPFDICGVRTGNVVTLKSPLFVKNRENRNLVKRSLEGQNISVLRPGMVLLKCYLSHSDQVKIVEKCRGLGRGPGGFYQPGYRDGAMLQLKMMCLGKIWDPQTSKYLPERPIDGAKPPGIPHEFNRFVKEAIQGSHAILGKQLKRHNVEEILPSMSPNICIVNFYRHSGKLGLHQDKDESPESLRNGLPVVSFSIGDSAEFLYGDERDIFSAKKVVLESGDVLIFGGKSRNIFHGVTSILPDTAPKPLLEETQLIPGRLNLTFREY